MKWICPKPTLENRNTTNPEPGTCILYLFLARPFCPVVARRAK